MHAFSSDPPDISSHTPKQGVFQDSLLREGPLRVDKLSLSPRGAHPWDAQRRVEPVPPRWLRAAQCEWA